MISSRTTSSPAEILAGLGSTSETLFRTMTASPTCSGAANTGQAKPQVRDVTVRTNSEMRLSTWVSRYSSKAYHDTAATQARTQREVNFGRSTKYKIL